MRRFVMLIAAVAFTAVVSPTASAQQTVQVFITNLSKQVISPPVVASHSWRTTVVHAAGTASDGLRIQAEDGDPSTLVAELEANDEVFDVAVGGGMLLPGERMILELEVQGRFDRISATGMLVTTNDGFFGLDGVEVPPPGFVSRLSVPVWDAGTEANSESCAFIPGPPCGSGGQRDTGGAEGFVHIHPGLHGGGDLSLQDWGWQNPAVRVSIVRD